MSTVVVQAVMKLVSRLHLEVVQGRELENQVQRLSERQKTERHPKHTINNYNNRSSRERNRYVEACMLQNVCHGR